MSSIKRGMNAQLPLAGFIITHLLAFGLGYLVYQEYQHFQNSDLNTPQVTASLDPRGDLTKDNILILWNEKRIEAGLEQVPVDPDAMEHAQARAEKVESSGVCQHDLTTPTEYGENLACGYSNAREVVDGWIDSPTHRSFILSKDLKKIGIGISLDTVVVSGSL
jgi:uncharacterized protein YkwD